MAPAKSKTSWWALGRDLETFRLAKFFTLTSFVVILVFTVILTLILAHRAQKMSLAKSEEYLKLLSRISGPIPFCSVMLRARGSRLREQCQHLGPSGAKLDARDGFCALATAIVQQDAAWTGDIVVLKVALIVLDQCLGPEALADGAFGGSDGTLDAGDVGQHALP